MSASLPIVRDFAPTEMTHRCNRNVTPFPWPFGTKALPLPLQCWIACEKYDEVLPLKREKMRMRIKTPFLTVILALPVMVSCIGKDRVIDVAALPATAQRLLSSEFSAKQISFIKAERDFLTLDYDVVFSDGSAIEFNSKGQWEEVNCRLGDVPPGLVPEAISQYLAANYPSEHIQQIERQRRGYEVKLTNGLELEFDKQLRLRDVDD